MNQEMFLSVMNKVIKGEKDTFSGDISETISMFKNHSLVNYLYPVFNLDEFRKYYFGAMQINTNVDYEISKLKEKLNEAKIPHIFIKGYYLKTLYPDENLRVMGDVDFLVPVDKKEETLNIIKSLGFKNELEGDKHTGFFKGKVMIEAHFSLQNDPDTESNGYFKNPFEHTENINSYTYKLEDTYHLVFLVSHFAHHMLNGGSGMRIFSDLYVYMNKVNFDYKYLEEELKKAGYLKLFHSLLTAVEKIFNYVPYQFSRTENIDVFINHILKCGTHGFSETNNQSLNQVSGRKNKLAYLLSVLFLPAKTMKKNYLILNKLLFLLPFLYVKRFFDLLFKKRSRKRAKDVILVQQKEVKEIKELYKNVGLLSE